LAGDLVAEAQRTRLPAPPFLARRIVLAVGRATSPVRGPSRPVRRVAQVLAPLGLILVVVAVHRATRESTRPGGETRPPASSAVAWVPGESSLLSLAMTPTQPAADRFFELGRALDRPLQAELDAVVQDARTAVQFLADNFLPERQPR